MEEKGIQEKIVSIVQENRQLAVRIPVEFSEKVNINHKNDKFKWTLVENEQGLSLSGTLYRKENEKED